MLSVAAAQPPCLPLDVEANVAAHAAAVRAAGARLVVFPELSLTGYALEAPAIAPGDPRLAPLSQACAETGTTALVGAPVEDRYIGVLAVDGAGARIVYRKMCLGGDEPRHFSRGSAPAALELDGTRLGLAVCKDTGSPEHAAATAALGIDAYVAGIVHRAGEGDLHEQRARRIARDHGVWVVIASAADEVGRSGIWAPGGDLVAQAGPEPGGLARAEIG
jgi:predicted amidohydrolase